VPIFGHYRCERCVNLDVRCDECRRRKALDRRAQRARRVARGLCRYCASAAMPDLQVCAEHLGSRHDSDERRFVDAARAVLDHETYLRIWAIVNEAKDGG
jgi:hypothetical protein